MKTRVHSRERKEKGGGEGGEGGRERERKREREREVQAGEIGRQAGWGVCEGSREDLLCKQRGLGGLRRVEGMFAKGG